DVGEIAKASQTKASSLPNQAEMFSAHVSSKILVLQKWINENHVDNSSFSVCTESQALEIGSVNFDDVSLHLECWEEFLFKFNEMKRTREVRRGRNGSHPVSETIARWREHNRQLDCSIDGEKRIQNLRQSDQSKVACEAKEDRKTTVADIAVPHQSAWSCDEGFERVYHNLASFRAVGASVSSANQIKFLITKLKDEVHSDHMNVSGSRESIIEFPTVELEDEGGRNEKPSVVADACNVELYQYMPEESPNLLQCGRNNHDGYEKSVLRNPSSTEKALSIIDGSNPKTEQLHKNFRWDMNQETAGTSILDCVDVNLVQRSPENCIDIFCSTGSHLTNGQLQKTLEHKLDSSDYGQEYLISSFSPLWENEQACLKDPTFSYHEKVVSLTWKIKSDSYTLDQENARSFALENIYSSNKTPVNQKPEKDDRHSAGSAVEIVRRIENGDGMSLGGPLIDISNITVDCMNMNRLSNEKRRPGKISYVSPFKSPRSSKPSTIESNCCGRISTRYPFQLKRKNLKDFFGGPPTFQDLSGSLPHEVSNMDADNAVTYRFYDASHHDEIGLETFQVMLLKSGASSSNATKESALKKILDGDVSPASMMVLCVSAIYSTSRPTMLKANDTNYPNEDIKNLYNSSSTVTKINYETRIELMDDVWLSKQLAAGKLFVGQKLRASKIVHMLIHINGTYRAHWDENYIKVSKGKVPRTLVGITRIYLILYKERYPNCFFYWIKSQGISVYHRGITSLKLDSEAIMSEQSYVFVDINDSDEGAKLCEILETAAEPEVLMADMTSKQLFSFSIYQAKQKEIRQSHLQKEIEKALKDAGLALRRPFFNPRKSVNLSNLGEIPLASFSSPMVDKDLFSHHHEGTVVGFYYLVKRARDQTYHLWVAKATENSTYSYKVIKVLHFSSMTNAFQGFNDEVRFAALLLPQVKTQKTGIEEAVYSGISILVRGNTKILYQIHVAWYRLQRG
ncbi:BRCA2, helical, partial [Musa troglodytarum]